MKGAVRLPRKCLRRRLKLSRRIVQYFSASLSFLVIRLAKPKPVTSFLSICIFWSTSASVSSAISTSRTSLGIPRVRVINASGRKPHIIFISLDFIRASISGKNRIASLSVESSYDSTLSGSYFRMVFTSPPRPFKSFMNITKSFDFGLIGTSLILALVIIPSVPCDPTKTLVRSNRALCSMFQR